jgi:hypothetical protein
VSTKIKVWALPGSNIRCTNASRERISIRAPGWDNFVEVRPNTKFEGDFRNQKVETIAPVLPIETGGATYPDGVRRATEEDIDEMLLFVPQILAETTLLPVSPTKIQHLVERCASRQGGAIAGIIDGPDGIDASIGMDVAVSDISDHKFVRAIWLGVHPGLRQSPPPQTDPRSHYGRRLFEFARWFHGQLEAGAGYPILMQFDVTTRVSLGAKLGMYERNAVPIGASFAYCSSGAFLNREAEAA